MLMISSMIFMDPLVLYLVNSGWVCIVQPADTIGNQRRASIHMLHIVFAPPGNYGIRDAYIAFHAGCGDIFSSPYI
jgi:endo-beta-N-acetylglucosaminidase D